MDSAWVMYTLPPAAQRWAPVSGAKPAKCMNPGHPHQMGHPRWNLRGGGDRNTLKEAARTFRSRGYELNSARSTPAPHACAHTCKLRPHLPHPMQRIREGRGVGESSGTPMGGMQATLPHANACTVARAPCIHAISVYSTYHARARTCTSHIRHAIYAS